MKKPRAPRNRTLTLSEGDRPRLRSRLLVPPDDQSWPFPLPNGTVCGDCLAIAPQLPPESVDLLVLDPPYNLNKDFNGLKFVKHTVDDYTQWLNQVITVLKPLLKPAASVYICGDWFSSISIFTVATQHFTVRNRITWEREKGRGSQRNWKNASEDIWFCTMSDDYVFNVDAVKLRRRVLAPYRDLNGTPKDWQPTENGNFRDTHPSNVWTDITIPFWSMPENTDHPTQKSEKLMAKLILASTNPGQQVFDPFLGSGTTSVVAKKLERRYFGIERDEEYCLLAERRLELADENSEIQGFVQRIFWERNTMSLRRRHTGN
ncbi:MAG: site-specific DNA-methyltransferase [Synechococcales cyanobacterium T60_A2020_003]|nr:site-specific DNA-methyltransferase [Synechococcales cyanobacterium T60_A2020_003]